MTERIGVIILNWNGVEYTRRCLQAVLRGTRQPDLVLVLDNGSMVDEAAVLQKEFHHPIMVVRSEMNLGFAAGNNAMLETIRADMSCDYVVLLNQDAVVAPDCLERLITYLKEHSDVAVAGPLVLNNDATIQSCGATVNYWTGKVTSLLQGQPGSAAPTEPQTVDVVVGNCFAMRLSTLTTVGLLDERYFAYYEEVDWCVQARKRGMKCVVVPNATIQHAKSGGFRTYLVTRNLIWFQKRYASATQLVYFWFYFWFYFIPERIKKGSHFKDLVRAGIDGWFNNNIGSS